jgi:sortase A
MRPPPLLRVFALVLLLCACLPLGHAAYMTAKAELAQVLLQRAWQRHLQTGAVYKPWPWADTAPVARLRVPRLAVDEIVLRGDSGRSLAFGPGWAESSARPGEPGLSVISAHRDTHFAFLRELADGDAIRIETLGGSAAYRVVSTRIVDARQEDIALLADVDALVLVTCYPFDALDARGPLRYVVNAISQPAQAVASARDAD